MRMNAWMLCLATCLAIAATVEAQPGGGRRGGGFGGGFRGNVFTVVGNEAAQKELGLSSDDVAKVKEVTDAYNAANREGMSGIQFGPNMSAEDREKMASVGRENSEKFMPKLKATMTADQFTRLQQLNWQNQGTGALSDPEMVKALALTKDQQDKIKSISDDSTAKVRELFANAGGGGGGFGANREKMDEINKDRDAKVNAVLTKDQTDKFASLKGKEFDVEQLRGFGRGGRGGQGGAGGNNNNNNGGGGGTGGARPKRPQPKAE